VHELSVAESLLDIIEESLGGKRILARATLTLGPLAGVCAESLTLWFPQVAKERGFGEPELIVNELPAHLHCRACGCDYETHEMFTACPTCSSLEREVLSGNEFTLDSVECVETGDAK